VENCITGLQFDELGGRTQNEKWKKPPEDVKATYLFTLFRTIPTISFNS